MSMASLQTASALLAVGQGQLTSKGVCHFKQDCKKIFSLESSILLCLCYCDFLCVAMTIN